MTIYREMKRGQLKKQLTGSTVRFTAEEGARYERQA